MLGRIARLLRGEDRRPFAALQVEVTTHCFLRCTFCPHESLRDRWTARHMSMEVYERLSSSFRLAPCRGCYKACGL
jgi:molybdenum cofactor biosynthesis enzyme MoaA